MKVRFMNEPTLTELAAKPANNTDKGDLNHTFRGESYFPVYERYIQSRRNAVDVLEIGVLNGGSLRLWRDYFPKARIWGADIDPERADHSGGRITVLIGDQSDAEFLGSLKATADGFDIVIDDASHIVSYILASFRALWPAVRPGGLYVIEDLRLSYEPIDAELWRKCHPGMTRNGSLEDKRHERHDLDNAMLELIRHMDHFTGDVRAIHFHPMMIVVEKVLL